MIAINQPYGLVESKSAFVTNSRQAAKPNRAKAVNEEHKALNSPLVYKTMSLKRLNPSKTVPVKENQTLSDCLIKLSDIAKYIDERKILHHIDLELMSHSITTIIGPNGAGKTTLLRIILGLDKPSQGTVMRRPGLRLGYVPQRFHKDPMLPLTAGRFLSLAPASPSPSQIEATLSELSALHLIGHNLSSLSGGETQRILLARALLNSPELLALDEPMQGVDLRGQAELYQLLEQIQQRRRCSIVMVSHDLHFVMAATNQVVCLNQHICCSGHPEDVREHPEYLALFGSADLAGLGVYSHHHDHDHGLDGTIQEPGTHQCHPSTTKHSLKPTPKDTPQC